MFFSGYDLMNLNLLGYCATLAYVIFENEVSTTPVTKPRRFGMVLFGIVTI